HTVHTITIYIKNGLINLHEREEWKFKYEYHLRYDNKYEYINIQNSKYYYIRFGNYHICAYEIPNKDKKNFICEYEYKPILPKILNLLESWEQKTYNSRELTNFPFNEIEALTDIRNVFILWIPCECSILFQRTSEIDSNLN